MPPPGKFTPTIPLRPSKPNYYSNKFPIGLTDTAKTTNDFQYASWGGWGELTFGILKLNGGDHSYGVLGQADFKGSVAGAELGWHRLESYRKTDTSTNYKYLIWSLFPKDLAWTGQTAENTNIYLELGSYNWGNYDFTAVAEPK